MARRQVGELVTCEGFDEPKPDPVLNSKTAQKVWPRVAEDLKTDGAGACVYKDGARPPAAAPL